MRRPIRWLRGGLAVLAWAACLPAVALGASVTASAGLNPVATAATTITASGYAEATESLFVSVESPGLAFEGSCSTDPVLTGVQLASYSGEPVSAGSFAKTFSFTPGEAGTYRICAYLDKESYESGGPTYSGEFQVAAATGDLSLKLSTATPNANQAVTVSASGDANVAVRLVVGIASSECTAGAFAPIVTAFSTAEGNPVGPGAFSMNYSYTPSSPGTHTVCGFLDTNGGVLAPFFGVASAVLTVPTEEEEHEADERTRRELEARASQRRSAEQAAKRSAYLRRPVQRLSVAAVRHSNGVSFNPGYTNLDITTSPYAYITVRLSRYGHETYHIGWGEHATGVAVVVPWSCKSPGGVYHYTVTAHTNVGRTLTRRGEFAPVSGERCHLLEREEAEAREDENRAATEKYEHELRAEQERIEHYEHNCRALGGTPVELEVKGEHWVFCRKADGGLIPVPH